MGRLVGVVGQAQHGKDTVAAYLVQAEGFVRRGLADALKEEAAAHFHTTLFQMWSHDNTSTAGWVARDLKEYVASKPPMVRAFLQEYGARQRALSPDYWVRELEKWWEGQGYPDLVVSDVRFENEAAWVRQHGGELWRVVRPDVSVGGGHISETEQLGIEVDRTFLNAGSIEDLHRMIKERR